MLAAQVGRFHPGLVLLQDGDDLLFGMPLALHRLVLSSGPDSSSPGSVQGGNVSKQKEFSDQIRSAILQLRELQDRPDPDQSRVDELTNRVEWGTRIFEERRKTINFVCEVPVVIEQRLFALARAIQQSLE